ncbi:MAG: VWA domain-containing protein [Flavobacteriales bacterium]|jgi:Ca-activated chloride channel family protein|nr:VWA domain-containing protein [Flavobacteriales bacterium]MBT6650795.1 VWA domain-containing protein [Flavobacteriales bacterium]MBT6964917.1 VWA domain-containing protein [Flavobacteriales bacterium]
MLRYEHIEYLNFLFGIPVLIIAMLLYSKWKATALALFGDSRLIKELMHSFSKRRTQIKNILTILIFILLIIGIANPQVGTKMEEVKREGVDLMIAIDLSNSMMAEDIKPNRLERAKLAISRLIDKLEGDRIGLIVFAGEAYVQLPITTDYSAAKLFLSTVSTNIVPTQGTEIAKAIDLSIQSFDMENAQNKAIIIITDGESHDEKAIESSEQANELGIFVHTLGMGLSKGGPIPIYNKYGNRTDYRKDRDGNTIISKLNEQLLQQIASAGKGTYVRANNSKAGLSTLFAEINKMEKKEIGTMVFTEYKDRFQLFIGLALLLLLTDLILLGRKNKWSNRINFYKD